MLANEHLGLVIRIATAVVPVAVYFLVLGLLNSRKHPQMLSGRTDFAMLILAISPTFVLPVLNWVGVSMVAVIVSAVGAGLIVAMLSPRGHGWVIYNMPLSGIRRIVSDALRVAGVNFRQTSSGFLLDDGTSIEVSGFPFLRNVSVRLHDGDDKLAHILETTLARNLATIPAETSPAASALLLIAIAMLVVPLTLMAGRLPEMVRILTDLIP